MATSTIDQQRRFAVFGAQGYLGRHLAAHLRAQGHRVDAYDLQPAAGPAFDVADPAHWDRADTDVDAVFFFAGMTGTHAGFEQYERYLAANELGLLHLLDRLRQRGHRPRVVFPSSRLVYRGRPEPLPEDAPQESKTVYAANKRAGEAFLQAYRAAFGIPTVVYRICVPYGNLLGQSYSYGTIGAFIRLAKTTGVIPLYGGGTPRRTFTHVQDVCAQIAATALRPEAEGQTYNVAGEAFALADVAGWIAARLNARVAAAPWPEKEWAIESGDTVFADEKIRALLTEPLAFRLRDWIAATDFAG